MVPTNTVNVNAEALTEQKLKELRKLLTRTGIQFIEMGSDDGLNTYDALVTTGSYIVTNCAEISTLLSQLRVLDELTRPVGSRGQTQHTTRPPELQVNREEFMRS